MAVSIEPKGRFAQMLSEAVEKKGLSLRDIAIKLDMTYEQLRKVWIGQSGPSKWLVEKLCKLLGMDLEEAERAVTADRMERKFGKVAYNILGKHPRLADIEDVVPQFTDAQWQFFVQQIRGAAQQIKKAGH